MNTYIIIFIVLLIILIYIYFKVIKKHKEIKSNSVLFISGAPKTGKSLLGVYTTIKYYKKALFKWHCKNVIGKIINANIHYQYEKPLLYSNIPLKTKYKCYQLTNEHLKRTKRLNYNSVIYIGEFSLVANSRLGQCNGFKNGIDYDLLNEQLLLFTKLIGHETHGQGKLIIDSQVIGDCHYSLKRCLSQYVYIHHNIDIPFFKILFVKELCYSEDNNANNTINEDIEDGLKWLIIPKRKYYKMYDYCCYSILTDKLGKQNKEYKIKNKKDLKANKIVSFVKYKTIENKERKKQNDKEIKKS